MNGQKRHGWIVPAVLACGAAWLIYQQGFAAAQERYAPVRVGIVDVTKILENCKKNKQWQEKAEADRSRVQAEFQQMRRELEALQANIKQRRPGSSDYFALMGEYEEKRALMEGRNSFYENKFTQEMQQWMEALYSDFVKVTAMVAQEKGLDIVLGKESLEMPAPTLRDFMLSVKTQKVLYSRQELDITDEVLAALDKLSN
ncbi:MAG: OmpH family outer membrane protein [Anaerohalosphaeraceae bacterium]